MKSNGVHFSHMVEPLRGPRNKTSPAPRLSATRETIWFEDAPATKKTPYQPLQSVGRSRTHVVFSNGHETVEDAKKKTNGEVPGVAMPEFACMLSELFVDAAKCKLNWHTH